MYPGGNAFVHNCGHDRIVNETSKYVKYFANSQALRAAALKASPGAVRPRSSAVSSTPAALRVHVEYQFAPNDGITSSQQDKLRDLMVSTQKVLQKYFYAKYPVSGALLLDPACEVYSGNVCTRYYPDFRNGGDVLCGPAGARINASHVVSNYFGG